MSKYKNSKIILCLFFSELSITKSYFFYHFYIHFLDHFTFSGHLLILFLSSFFMAFISLSIFRYVFTSNFNSILGLYPVLCVTLSFALPPLLHSSSLPLLIHSCLSLQKFPLLSTIVFIQSPSFSSSSHFLFLLCSHFLSNFCYFLYPTLFLCLPLIPPPPSSLHHLLPHTSHRKTLYNFPRPSSLSPISIPAYATTRRR